MDNLVLVTGASGFVGLHCVKLLLANGFNVRGTVRSLRNARKIEPLNNLKRETTTRGTLQLCEADLMNESSWEKAVNGCTSVLHVAAPVPLPSAVEDELKLIELSVEGTMNVLRAAARENTVRRVVITSSISAVCAGVRKKNEFDEKDYSRTESRYASSYDRSKTLAEKAAWQFVKQINQAEGRQLELVTICPGLILGPNMHGGDFASSEAVARIMRGGAPLVPRLYMPIVDVRDVARAMLRALEQPNAAGERILLVNQPSTSFVDIARILHAEFRSKGYLISTIPCPFVFVKVGSWFSPTLRYALPFIDRPISFDTRKMKNLLEMNDLIPPSQSIVEMAYNLIEHGQLPKKY
uniref:NAD-dependent epimerase/dehydratase domain-containing protein n=1 Tax=Plectus sambesii TaxID=2011161 RepID=A0A914UJD6_9BILA